MESGQENGSLSKGSETSPRQEAQKVNELQPQQTIDDEQSKLAEVRAEIAAFAPHQTSESTRAANNTPYEPIGFKQAPLRVLRNRIFYATRNSALVVASVTAGVTIPAFLLASALGYPEVAAVTALAGQSIITGEVASLLLRNKGLGSFLAIHKDRLGKEKVLRDEIKIGLDDSVGELYVSGIVQQWKMRFEKGKTRKSLVIMSGVLEGLVNLANKTEEDSWFKDIRAFTGESYVVNPSLAQRFGFQVEDVPTLSTVQKFVRFLDKKVRLMPKDVGVQGNKVAWISRENLMAHKEVIKEELDKVQRALARRQP